MGVRLGAALIACLLSVGVSPAAEIGKFEDALRKPNRKNEAAEARALTPPSCEGDSCLNPLYYLLIPFIPYALVMDLPHQGFRDYPFAPSDAAGAFAEGPHTPAQRLESSYQRVSSAIGGLGARYRMVSRNRLGLDFSWTRYRQRYNRVDLNLFNADATGTFYQDDRLLGFFGLGLVGLSGTRTNLSAEGRLGGDWYPFKPVNLEMSYGLGAIHGNGFGDFRAGAGVELWRLQFRLGYRALLGPTSHLSGPEASVALWF